MSEIRATTISDAAGTGPIALTKQWAAKSVCNYAQTTNTVLMGENVSSVTDVATGRYSVNYSNAFDAAEYSRNSSSNATHALVSMSTKTTLLAQQLNYAWNAGSGTNAFAADASDIGFAAHGDLA